MCVKRMKAFTLAEILVVTAIISILLGVLLPVFSASREKSRQTVCISNLRQIGIAIGAYAQDYDSLYPLAANANPVWIADWIPDPNPPEKPLLDSLAPLHEVLKPYGTTPTLWQCPSDTGLGQGKLVAESTSGKEIQVRIGATVYGSIGTSYLYRTAYGIFGTAYPAYCIGPDGNQVDSSQVGVLADASSLWHDRNAPDSQPGRRNNLYADGHVAFLTFEQYIIGWECGVP